LALVIASLVNSFTFDLRWFIPSRILKEGLSSPRWTEQVIALRSALDLQHPFGGFTNQHAVTPWVHNIYLDVYRVCGSAPALFLFCFTLFAIYSSYHSIENRFLRVFSSCIAALIGASSVPLEGHILEAVYIMLIMFNSYFVKIHSKGDDHFQSPTRCIKPNS
jgi:hypothetical protein